MKNIKFLIFIPLLTSAYNLDVQNPIIKTSGIQRTNNSFFGYDVLLYAKNSINGSSVRSWIIVGAPKANYTSHPDHGNKIPEEPGVAYRCPLGDSCVPINLSNPDDELGFIDQLQLNTLIEKSHGWLGAAMSVDNSTGLLTVCGPRTIVRVYKTFAIRHTNTMHGVCYTGQVSSGRLSMEDKNFSTFDFASGFWYNPMNGFAVHYPAAKIPLNSIRPVIGSPKHELYGTVHEIGQQKRTELPISDDLTQFGYALTSGYYFHKDELMVVGGAPGWQYLGQVAIMDLRTDLLSIVVTIDGKEIGEFFGASLATGDLNKDGLDDLIVGAPHWKNDNGRVHIFLGNKAGFFEADILLEGGVDDALYGYSVTSGDLDGDGYDDLIVGAPWEESGVIYVYNGDAKLHEIKLIEPSQRIVASSIRSDILRFGFSLAKPVDVDGNGFLDIAVGAYASGHAVVLLSKPVLRTEMTVTTIPTILSRNSTSFIMEVCVQNFMKDKPSMWAFECVASVDDDHKRIIYKTSNKMILTWHRPPDRNACDNTTFFLSNTSRNFVDVIDVVVTHRLLNSSYKSQGHQAKCKLCPIEYKGSHSTVVRAELPFDIGCGMDDICQAFIFAKLIFPNIRKSTWIIGSDGLSLVLSIGNHAEPAYLTTVTFYIPNGISLKSILPSCQEEKDGQSLRVTCEVGNPLGTAKEEIVRLDLDMKRMHGSADNTKLEFRADIKTRSVNRGVLSVAIPLYLKANFSIALSGKAYDDNYYLNYKNEKSSNVTFQHKYQISRFGETPISNIRLTIRVPYKYGNLEFLTLMNKPKVSVLGRFYECSVSDVTILGPRINVEKGNKNKFGKIVHLDSFANNTRIRRALSLSKNDKLTISPTDVISNSRIGHLSESNSTIRSEFYTMPELKNTDVIYLNCSNSNVNCGQITCSVSSLKTSQDVGELQLQLVIDNAKLTGEADERVKLINFVTESSLQVINPTTQFNILEPANLVHVTTKFHRAPMVKNVSIWIIIGSVFMGLLSLIVLAIILKKIGFFKRNEKDKLETLKSNEAIPLDSNPFLFNE